MMQIQLTKSHADLVIEGDAKAAECFRQYAMDMEQTWFFMANWNAQEQASIRLSEAELGDIVRDAWRNFKLEQSNLTGDPFFNHGRFVPKLLGDEILKKHQFATIMDTKEVYEYKDGLWSPTGESTIHTEVLKNLGNATKSHYGTEVAYYVRGATYTDRKQFNADTNLINLANGVYDLAKRELKEHSADQYFTQIMRVNFDPNAKCPNVEKFLSEILPDENDRQGILELFGYCLYRSYSIQKAFMLVGDGANGKSTLIGLLKAFLGKDNVTSISLHEIEENRFCKSQLYAKAANLYPDLTKDVLYKTGTFKMITGGDPITAEKKFRDPFNFENYAKQVFSANQVPATADDSEAFYRRWIIINFPNKFEADKADKNLLGKLTTPSELSGLLNLALKALNELLQRGQFANDKPTNEWREKYTRLSDSVKCFIMDRIERSTTDYLSKSEVYSTYTTYCRDKNYPVVTESTFTKRLLRELPVEDYRPSGGDRTRCWRGLKLRGEAA